MANLDRNLTVLLSMKKYCKEIFNALDYFKPSIEDFRKKDYIRNSISFPLFQVCELVNHLTPKYLEKTKDKTNWNFIRGMRNRFAHGYGKMDLDVIYSTAKEDIPELYKFIENEINNSFKRDK